MDINLETNADNTWCPGCGNFGISAALKSTIKELVEEGTDKKDIVLVSGIGCGSKIIDYFNINTFSSLHGRPVAAAEGVKIGNPDLEVITSIGDGGAYNEGISHLVHAAKRNINITVLVHNNRNFALTTGQFTATSPSGFKGDSTPEGSPEMPIDPLELMFSSGASFIARGYSFRGEHLQDLVKRAVNHEGFSFVDVLQPCVTFFDATDYYNERIYEMEEIPEDREEVMEKIQEWDYEQEGGDKIPLGIFYQEEKPTYKEQLLGNLNPAQDKKDLNPKEFLNVQGQ